MMLVCLSLIEESRTDRRLDLPNTHYLSWLSLNAKPSLCRACILKHGSIAASSDPRQLVVEHAVPHCGDDFSVRQCEQHLCYRASS